MEIYVVTRTQLAACMRATGSILSMPPVLSATTPLAMAELGTTPQAALIDRLNVGHQAIMVKPAFLASAVTQPKAIASTSAQASAMVPAQAQSTNEDYVIPETDDMPGTMMKTPTVTRASTSASCAGLQPISSPIAVPHAPAQICFPCRLAQRAVLCPRT